MSGGGVAEAGLVGVGSGEGPEAVAAGDAAVRAPAPDVRRDGWRRDPREEEEVSWPVALLLLPEAAQHCGREDAVSV